MSDEDDKQALEPIAPHLRDLVEAKTIPDTKDVHDRAVALEAYAREAKNSELIDHAVEVRLRAERKVGELLREAEESGERAGRGAAGGWNKGESSQSELLLTPDQSAPPKKTLADYGVTKRQSHLWQKLALLDDKAFEKRIAEARKAAVQAIEMTAKERTVYKQERRAEREREQAETILALPEKRYGAILSDVESRFEPYSRETGMDRAADNHYATSTLEQLKARDVQSIAADDCALFFWTTVPMLAQALQIIEAWGFTYKSHCVWLKDKTGTGYWFRNVHELLLLATRGEPPCPAPGTQWESAWDAPTGSHSEKPDAAYELIEHYFPTIPKIELNARGTPRHGWDAWGLEAKPAEEEIEDAAE